MVKIDKENGNASKSNKNDKIKHMCAKMCYYLVQVVSTPGNDTNDLLIVFGKFKFVQNLLSYMFSLGTLGHTGCLMHFSLPKTLVSCCYVTKSKVNLQSRNQAGVHGTFIN